MALFKLKYFISGYWLVGVEAISNLFEEFKFKSARLRLEALVLMINHKDQSGLNVFILI